jgi:DNA-binding NarL/FixJ family response regulator
MEAMTVRTTVFIWYSHPLFAQAIAALLRREGLVLTGVEEDPTKALAAIAGSHPDVVITDMVVEREHPLGITEIIRSCERVRILVLDPLNEEMRIYDGHGTAASKLAAIVQAITDAAPESAPVAG